MASTPAGSSTDPSIERILGVDVVPPKHSIGRAEFVRADIRNPMIGRIMAQAEVDTVVHMNVIATPKDTGGRVTQKEINVIGTMQLLAACQKSESVKRLVVKSSAAVYGSSPRDPAMFTEDMNPKTLPRTGFGKDSVEVEGYVRGFSRRRPDVEITMLRLANVVGPSIHTAITDYFSLPARADPARLRRPLPVHPRGRRDGGHDPRDHRAARRHRQRRGRRVPHRDAVHRDRPPPRRPGAALGGRRHRHHRQAQRLGRLLVRPADLPRLRPRPRHARMRSVLEFEPHFTTREAFEDYARHLRPAVPGVEGVGEVVSDAAGGTAAALSRVFDRIQP